MFGSLLSSAIKIVTIPIDVANASADILTGGDGSKESRNGYYNCTPLSMAEQMRDAAAKAAKEIDED